VWRWLATGLMGVALFLAGFVSRQGVSRDEAAQIVAGSQNPYIADREALHFQLQCQAEDLKAIKDQLLRLSVAMGVQPDGSLVARPRSDH